MPWRAKGLRIVGRSVRQCPPGRPRRIGALVLVACLAAPAMAQELHDFQPPPPDATYSPYLRDDYPDRVFFGDTHLHTAYSADAGLVGATLTPDDAFGFAKGEEVISSQGVPARLQRPLDFLVVADHAENLGLPVALEEQNPALEETEWGRDLVRNFAPRTDEARASAYEAWVTVVGTGSDPLAGTGFGQTMWERATEAADRHNEPGRFTAFIGFEWTTQPGGNNLHRVVSSATARISPTGSSP